MKSKLFFISLFVSVFLSSFSQKAINDKTLNAQERRQVFIRWGDWQPPAKYILGAQVNVAHSRVWGWLGPSANQEYKKGRDIRPLSPTGTQTLRQIALLQQEEISNKMLEETNELADLARKEIIYHEGALSKLDPLYYLYFKKTLKPIMDYSQYDILDQCRTMEVFQYLSDIGLVNQYATNMNILQERLFGLFSSDIERGQRIIAYHTILEDYRSERKTFDRHVSSIERFLSLKAKKLYNPPSRNDNDNTYNGSYDERDRQIAREIMEQVRYNSKFK